MKPYLDLLRHVRDAGVLKPTRCVLKSTGEHVDALSVFAPPPFRWDLADGFPLVTTKRVSFDAIVHELLWFLSGSNDVKELQAKGVHIWDQWARPDGTLGASYGTTWRRWEYHEYDAYDCIVKHIDQIGHVVDGIREAIEDPRASVARRLIVSAWDVEAVWHGYFALPPCHVLSQFDVTAGRLSCHLYQRSADLFLGVPYNIASYALLTHMLAQVTGLGVGSLTISFGDAHIYANHLDQVDEQLARKPLPPPTLRLDPSVGEIDGFRREHMEVVGYESHPALRGEVAV